MNVDKLIDAIGDIDDELLEEGTFGRRPRSRIPWGLISAAACFCLLIGSVIFLRDLLPALPTKPQNALSGFEAVLPSISDPWVLNTHEKGALSEDLFYFKQDDLLHTADLHTGEVKLLCEQHNCSHNSARCPSVVLSSDSTFFFANDCLYYIDGTNRLCRRDADGKNDRVVGTICKAYASTESLFHLEDMIVTKSYLYYTTKGSYNRIILGRIHLTTGVEELLLAPDAHGGTALSDYDLTLCAARDSGVMFLRVNNSSAPSAGTQDATDPIDPEFSFDPSKDSTSTQPPQDPGYEPVDPEYTYPAVDLWEGLDSSLIYWDANTGVFTTLLKDSTSQLQGAMPDSDGLIYFWGGSGLRHGDYRVSAYDPVSGTVAVVFRDAAFTPLGKDYILLMRESVFPLVSLKTGELLPSGGSFYIHVQDSSQTGMVFSRTVEIESDGSSRYAYYYIPFAAMADGIQQTDLQELFLWQTR